MKNTKICKKCGKELPLNDFYKHPKMADGYFNVCKKCSNECRKQYYKKGAHTKQKTEYMRHYRHTPMGRANMLLQGYNRIDKEKNREKGNLTAQWIVDNIFNKPCAHCGETDWTKLGCNRLDNSKPHTIENVEPCCWECGKRQPRK